MGKTYVKDFDGNKKPKKSYRKPKFANSSKRPFENSNKSIQKYITDEEQERELMDLDNIFLF